MLTQIERLYSEFQSHSAERARTHEFPLVTTIEMITIIMRVIGQWHHCAESDTVRHYVPQSQSRQMATFIILLHQIMCQIINQSHCHTTLE